MGERKKRAGVRRKGRKHRKGMSRRPLPGLVLGQDLSLTLAGVALVVAMAGTGAVEAANIDPGTFVFNTSAPGLLEVSRAKLEAEVCGRAPSHARRVGGLTNIFAPGEIIDINANMNIQGMVANPNNFGVVAAAPLQLRLLNPVDFGNAQGAIADVVASRFCMETIAPVPLSCGDFDVVLALDPAVPQKTGRFVLIPDQPRGGIFFSDVELSLALKLTDKQRGITAQVAHVVSYAGSGQWAYSPGAGGAAELTPFWVDSDCDGEGDTLAPETPDFFPGWTPSGLQTEVVFTDLEKGGYLRLEPPLKRK